MVSRLDIEPKPYPCQCCLALWLKSLRLCSTSGGVHVPGSCLEEVQEIAGVARKLCVAGPACRSLLQLRVGISHRSASSSVAAALIAWHARQGRHDLPWQSDRTPYRVWVSEIMLQQTQVATVIPYYLRFMQRFPDVRALADAPIDDVLHLWTGLGYYARARNMHRAAALIRDEFGGEFPQTFDEVAGLPGIGRSTAGAILALSCGQRFPIMDGNVKRVLSRYFGVEGSAMERAVSERLWKLADECTPAEGVDVYTQAITPAKHAAQAAVTSLVFSSQAESETRA